MYSIKDLLKKIQFSSGCFKNGGHKTTLLAYSLENYQSNALMTIRRYKLKRKLKRLIRMLYPI